MTLAQQKPHAPPAQVSKLARCWAPQVQGVKGAAAGSGSDHPGGEHPGYQARSRHLTHARESQEDASTTARSVAR